MSSCFKRFTPLAFVAALCAGVATAQPVLAPEASSDTLLVELSPQRGYGPFQKSMGGAGTVHEPGEAWYGLRGAISGAPDTLQEGQLLFHDFDFEQLTYQRYRQGALSAEKALSALTTWGTDTLGLSPEPVDVSVAVFAGRDAEGRHVFVFDTDNDEDLSDERAATLPAEAPEDVPWFEAGATAQVAY